MILVTGATGSNGSELIRQLAPRGVRIRAMARKAPTTPNALPHNVEFVSADFNDEGSLKKALDGVERAFLATNSTHRVESQQLCFVQAAAASGVRHVVYLSQLHARPDSPVRFLRYHAVVEAALAYSGMAYTNLRPNLFMQGLLAFAPSIRSQGRFYAPAGDARVSVVDVRDIAAVAATTLTQPGHGGKTYNITGPEALTHRQLANQISDVVGKPVEYVDVSEVAMRGTLLSYGMPAWQADGLIEDYEHYRRGEAAAVSQDVERVTGTPPRSFGAFLSDYKQAFLSS